MKRHEPTKPLKDNNLRFLQEMLAQGKFVFSVTEAKNVATKLGIKAKLLNFLLSNYVKEGWLLRLRRGVYAGTGTLPGEFSIHPFVVATQLIQPSAVSHFSALHHHGFTEQIPQLTTAFTSKKVVIPSMRKRDSDPSSSKHLWETAGIRVEVISVKPSHFFGIEELWIDQHFKVSITDKERSILEMFISPRYFGGMGEVLGILEEHHHELDIAKLTDYALRIGKSSVARRLGWALEYFGVEASLVEPLRKISAVGFSSLDPTRPRRGSYNKRWMIQDNITPPKEIHETASKTNTRSRCT